MKKRGVVEYKIIIPTDLKPRPEYKEISAAKILASFFKADVEFVPRSHTKTVDFLINGVTWELKSPTGDGKRNIQHQFSRAMLQSNRIIIDARKSKMPTAKLVRELEKQFKQTSSLKGLILLTKSRKTIDFSNR